MRFIFGLAVLAAVCASHTVSAADTPQTIVARVKAVGARVTVAELYSKSNRWKAVLVGVSSGSPAWLEVARQLNPGTDGETAEVLTESAGNALDRNAPAALRILWRDFGRGMCQFPVNGEERYSTKAKALLALESRAQALRAVNDPTLSTARDACLAELLTWRNEIEQMYAE